MPRLMSTRLLVTVCAIDDDAGRDKHRLAPLVHVAVLVVADLRVIPRAPAAEQHAAPANLLITGECLVEEVEEVVMQWHDLLHVLDVLHQSDEVVSEDLLGGDCADAARVEGRGVDMTPFHQAEHLPRQTAHLEAPRGKTPP